MELRRVREMIGRDTVLGIVWLSREDSMLALVGGEAATHRLQATRERRNAVAHRLAARSCAQAQTNDHKERGAGAHGTTRLKRMVDEVERPTRCT